MGGQKAAAQTQQEATPPPAEKKTRGGFYGYDQAAAGAGSLDQANSRRNQFLGG